MTPEAPSPDVRFKPLPLSKPKVCHADVESLRSIKKLIPHEPLVKQHKPMVSIKPMMQANPTVLTKPVVSNKPLVSVKPSWCTTISRSNSSGNSRLSQLPGGVILHSECTDIISQGAGWIRGACKAGGKSGGCGCQIDCFSDCTSESGYNSPQSVGNSNSSISQVGVKHGLC